MVGEQEEVFFKVAFLEQGFDFREITALLFVSINAVYNTTLI